MIISGDTLQLLLDSGVPAAKLAEIIRAIDADYQTFTPPRDETAAERKKAWDRDYQRQKREAAEDRTTIVRQSYDPLETKVSPTPPSKTQSPDTPSDPKGSSVPTILPFAKPNGFDRFWEAYPRKTGKGGARKAFVKALAKIGGPDPFGVLMAALELVKPTWRDRQYVPHPATWLNDERWEDEPEIPPPREDDNAAMWAEAKRRIGDG